MQKSTMGIYVINKEGEEIGAHDDIGIYVEGVIILDNIGSVAQACAMMLGVIYVLNMAYPKKLKYFYEFIQKVLLKMDGERLSSKVLGLKNLNSMLDYDFLSCYYEPIVIVFTE
uniref:k31 n=1 Tax=Danio rerio TaxID=7955 RepID=UPI00004C9CC7|nr:k31 [Danio rerio]AAW78558.1 unknown [Danio rerio]